MEGGRGITDYGVSFWDDENVSELHRDADHTTL